MNRQILPESPKLNNVLDFERFFPNEQACRDHFEKIRWSGNIVCPHCKSDKCSKFKSGKLYWCKGCKKQFTVRVGTIFEDSALPLIKWFMAIYLLTSRKKGISSVQLGKDIGVTQKTAWFMLHRIRHAVRTESLEKPLSGIIEADETFIGGKMKGGTVGRGSENKTMVFGMLERGGRVVAETIEHASKKTIQTIMRNNIDRNAVIMTDEHKAYLGLEDTFDSHETVNHGTKEYARPGGIHVNSIESFWALFKRGVVGTFHHVSEKHLNKYVDEFEHRYNSKSLKDADRFTMTLGHLNGRLTYKQLKYERGRFNYFKKHK